MLNRCPIACTRAKGVPLARGDERQIDSIGTGHALMGVGSAQSYCLRQRVPFDHSMPLLLASTTPLEFQVGVPLREILLVI